MAKAKSILLVEDDILLAMLETRQLEDEGYIVIHMPSGEKAIEFVREKAEEIDLILMDIDLGMSMDGTEAASEILKDYDIPVVFLSSHTEKEIVEKTEKITSYGYVVKDSGITVLDASIKMAFKLYEAHQTLNIKNQEIESANKELQRANILLEDAFEQTPIPMVLVSMPDAVIRIANSACQECLGIMDEPTPVGTPLLNFQPSYKDYDSQGNLGALEDLPLARALRGQKILNQERRIVTKDGIEHWSLVSGTPIYNKEGEIIAGYLIFPDITDRKKAEAEIIKARRLYAVISQINQMVVRTRDKQKIFTEACRIAIEFGKFRMAWIGLIDEKEKEVIPVAWDGLDEGYLDRIRKISIRDIPQGRGPTGTAIRNGKYVCCNDIMNAPSMAPWKDDALARGYRSSIALPIIVNGKVEGAFTLYASDPFFFNDSEIRLLEEVTGDIAYSLEIIDAEEKRQKVEEELTMERVNSSLIMETSPIGIVFVDSNGKVTFANQRAEEILGLKKDDIKQLEYNSPQWHTKDIDGQPFPDDKQPFTRVKKTREIVRGIQHAIEWPDGKRVILSINAAPLIREGEFEGMVASIEDITDRKNNEIELNEKEKQYHHIFENSGTANAIFDLQCRLVLQNSFSSIQLGKDPSESIGKNVHEIFGEQRGPIIKERMLRVLSTGGAESFETEFNLATGEKCFRSLYQPIMDEQKKIIGIQVISQDITEQKRNEQALKASEEKFRTLVNNVNVGIFISNMDGKFLFANEIGANMAGYDTIDEFLQIPARSLYADVTEMEHMIEELRTNGAVKNMEISSLRKDGKIHPISMNSIIQKDETGAPSAIFGVIEDISERKLTEKELRHLLEQKEILMKELQHRVKNNLNVISSLLMFEKDKLTDNNSIQVFNNAISRIRSMLAIYSQLYLSKDMLSIDLAIYIKKLADSIFQTYVIDKAKINLVTSIDEVALDMKRSVHLGLILNELITNALKYAYPQGTGGEVRINLKKSNMIITLSVEDDGGGLPEGLDPNTRDSLGLMLIKLLTDQLKGELKIETEKGLKVSVVFNL